MDATDRDAKKTRNEATGQQPESTRRRRSLFAKLFQSRAKMKRRAFSSDHGESDDSDLDSSQVGKDSRGSKTEKKKAKAAEFFKSVRSSTPRSEDQDSYELDLGQRITIERIRMQLNEQEAEEAEFGFEDDYDTNIDSDSGESSKVKSDPSVIWQTSELHKKCEDKSMTRRIEIEIETSPSIPKILEKEDLKLIDDDLDSFKCDKSTMTGDMEELDLKGEDMICEHEKDSFDWGNDNAVERDLRLINWRRLAARQRSPNSDDSDLEDLLGDDSLSQALVITCSDDTSCSSVELIWSRRTDGYQPNLTPSRSGLSAEFRPISSGSYKSGGSTADFSSPNRMEAQLVKPESNPGGLFRRFSVLELAKPSRAKALRRRSARLLTSRASGDWISNPLFSEDTDNTRYERHSTKSSVDLTESAPVAGNMTQPKSTSDSDNSNLTSNKKTRNDSYLSQLMNLDKKIKSNVTSIKNQLSEKLSDTSKRASILADHLITSIKDSNIKEQFSFSSHTDGNGRRGAKRELRRRKSSSDDKVNSTFSEINNQMIDLSQSSEKAKLFSMIYMHQQRVNGHPVITSQPTSMIGLKVPIIQRNDKAELSDDTKPCDNTQDVEIIPQKVSDFGPSQASGIDEDVKPAKILSSSTLTGTRKTRKKLRKRKSRVQVNVAKSSDDETD